MVRRSASHAENSGFESPIDYQSGDRVIWFTSSPVKNLGTYERTSVSWLCLNRGVAQLGLRREFWELEIGGSNPSTSTIGLANLLSQSFLSFPFEKL